MSHSTTSFFSRRRDYPGREVYRPGEQLSSRQPPRFVLDELDSGTCTGESQLVNTDLFYNQSPVPQSVAQADSETGSTPTRILHSREESARIPRTRIVRQNIVTSPTHSDYSHLQSQDEESNINLGSPPATSLGHYQSQPPSNYGQLVHMMQSQQAILQEVLAGQSEIKARQANFDQRLLTIEDCMSKLEETHESGPRKKKRVTRQLSSQVSKIYEEMENSFKLEESSLSHHNQSVKAEILDQIISSPLCTEKEDTVKAAIQRKYEALRRSWLMEDKENHEETLEAIAKCKRHRSRRQRKYDNRMSVTKESEMKLWKEIDQQFMTEESDDYAERTVIVQHKLTWRSSRLNKLIDELDKRYESKVSREGGTMPRKERRMGLESTSVPPIGAPKWAVQTDIIIITVMIDAAHSEEQ